jgi:hypothetical protein
VHERDDIQRERARLRAIGRHRPPPHLSATSDRTGWCLYMLRTSGTRLHLRLRGLSVPPCTSRC